MKSVSNLKSDRAYEQLATWIRSGKFMPGNRLPSEQALSRELGVNHQTLRRGLEKLVTDGLVVKRPSVGNFVAQLPDVVEIALVLPDWMRKSRQQHPLTGLLLSGVHQKIDPRHHSVSIYYYRQGYLWADVGVVLASRRVRGAIISINYTIDIEEVRQFIDANIHVALIGNYPPNLTELGLPCFRYDPSLAIAPMMRRLYELGHREIAIFEYALEMPHLRAARHQVVQRLAQELGIKAWSDMFVKIPNADGHPQLGIVKEVLDCPNRPTALIVPDELIANEVFTFCYQHQVRIPEDLSLVALCDNQPLNHAVDLTALDTVWLYTQEAQMATEHLVNAIAGQKQSCCDVILHGQINWTDSIGPPSADREVAVGSLDQPHEVNN